MVGHSLFVTGHERHGIRPDRFALAVWVGLSIEIEIGYTLCAALSGLASGLMGAIYPALRVAGQDAVEALSYE